MGTGLHERFCRGNRNVSGHSRVRAFLGAIVDSKPRPLLAFSRISAEQNDAIHRLTLLPPFDAKPRPFEIGRAAFIPVSGPLISDFNSSPWSA